MASDRYRNYKRLRYSCHIKRTQANLKRNPKQFWSFVNEKRMESGFPSQMFLGDTTSSSLENTCNLFAEHFAGVFNRSTATPDQINIALQNVPSNVVDLNMVEFSVDDVRSAILKLKPSFSAGPDGIPAIVLKNCAAALSKPLKLLFNLSIQTGQFPSCWKESYMFPVFKKGNKRNVANYRGITSLCAGSKLMEILMQQVLLRATRMYISNDQHGFYPGRSTNTNLVEFTSFCIRTMEGGGQVDAVYTDLKAAFDRIDHRMLLAKLSRIGVSDDIVRWFESYLSNRSLTVKLGDAESVCFNNSSGVPQGSNIGPLLFTVFYNDVCFVLPPGCRILYADDLKIFREISCNANCVNLQLMINAFTEWCAANFLTVSTSKCNVISFTRKKNNLVWPYTIHGEPLERVSVVKDLGVLLDAKMTFEDHYNCVLSKANRNLGFMLRMTKEFRDPSCLRVLFFALVRSHLESAVVVWCPSSDLWISRMESVQRRFSRSMLRLQPWPVPGEMPTYEQRCALLNLDSLSSRRTYHRAAFLGKVLLGSIDAPNVLARGNINAIPRTLRRRDFLRFSPIWTERAYSRYE